MGRNCKECFQLLISADINADIITAIIELLKEFLNSSTNYSAEDMLYIMSILAYFENAKLTTKLLDLYMDETKLKIRRILTEHLLCEAKTDNGCVCELKDEKEPIALPKVESKTNVCDNVDDDNIYENFEGFIIKKKYIPSGEDGGFRLPLEGQTSNLKIKDELLDPDYIYYSEVEIDWQGNVLNYITAPKKIAKNFEIQEMDFDDIYHELLNEIHEYKEKPVV